MYKDELSWDSSRTDFQWSPPRNGNEEILLLKRFNSLRRTKYAASILNWSSTRKKREKGKAKITAGGKECDRDKQEVWNMRHFSVRNLTWTENVVDLTLNGYYYTLAGEDDNNLWQQHVRVGNRRKLSISLVPQGSLVPWPSPLHTVCTRLAIMCWC